MSSARGQSSRTRPSASTSSGGGKSGAGSSMRASRSKSPGALPGEQPGLRGLVQIRLLNDVFQTSSDKWDGWKILIVDEHAMRVISSAVGMYDIMEKKITLVESLEKKRAPFPDMGAVYLVEPSEESVQKIVDDFASGKALYGQAVFLYFLGRLPDQLLDKIKQCRTLLKRVKALSEINIDFLAKEERAFTLDMRDSFKSFYLRTDATPAERLIADKLVTVCATLNEYPHIRYRQSSAVCNSLSAMFHLKMEEFVRQNPSWWYHGGPAKNQQAAKRERGTLLLLDRADDCLTPLMHDFTYQAMVHDLLKMDGDRISYENEQGEAKDVLLDEKDSVWVELRGKHIAGVIDNLSSRIRDIMNSSTGSSLGGGSKGSGNMSLSEMASALKALPEYREVMSKLSQHMHLAHECMDVFRNEGLMELSEFEQTVATGKDDDGRSPALADIVDTAERLLMKMKDPKARLRLILVLTISQGGLRQQDRRRLMNAAELSRADMKTLNSLEILGLSTLAASDKNKLVSMLKGSRVSGGAASDDESEYAGCRYVPALRGTLEELSNNALSMEEYPSVLPMPDQGQSNSSGAKKATSARSSRRADAASSVRKSSGASSLWAKSTGGAGKRSTGPINFSGGRCLIFMVGGLSFSELKVARDVMNNESREIIVGSTTFLSPTEFLDDLAELGQDDDV